MSERKGKGTFYRLTQWFRWASLIILLVPLACFGCSIAIKVQGSNHVAEQTSYILNWVSFGASIVWFILNIIMFFAAGTIKGQASPLKLRIGLLLSFILVVGPTVAIISIILCNPSWTGVQWIIWLLIFMPLISAIGYIIGFISAGSAKRKLA